MSDANINTNITLKMFKVNLKARWVACISFPYFSMDKAEGCLNLGAQDQPGYQSAIPPHADTGLSILLQTH